MRFSWFEWACIVAIVWVVMSLVNGRHRTPHAAMWIIGMVLLLGVGGSLLTFVWLMTVRTVDPRTSAVLDDPTHAFPATTDTLRDPGARRLPLPKHGWKVVRTQPMADTTIADADSVVNDASESNSRPEETSTATPSEVDHETVAANEASTDQPDWVDAPPKLERGVYTESISVGPYATRQECGRELAYSVQQAAKEYTDQYLGSAASGRFSLPQPYLMEHVVKEVWWQEHELTVGEFTAQMFYEHARLEFDGKTRAEITERYRESMVAVRLVQVGGGAAMIWGLLAAVFGYLKLDTWTRGYYTGRLRLLAGVVILGLMGGLSALIMRTQ